MKPATWFGPIYQQIVPGDIVRIKRRRAKGEVVAVKDYLYGVPKSVYVEWDKPTPFPQAYDTDCLEIVRAIPRPIG